MHETQAILLSFDQYLTERRLQFDAVVIGGAALNLLGVVSRLTKDAPASLAGQLLPRWENRLQTVFVGKAIYLRSLGREDLLCAKLFALCDRGIDLRDCIALAPSVNELESVLPWLERQDANPDWPAHVRATIADLRRRLGHGI
jgi:hypothetical protein